MTSDLAERWQRVAALVDAVLECDPAQRRDYLEWACAGEQELRGEAEALLSLAGTPSFLDSTVVDFAAPLLAVAFNEDPRDAPVEMSSHVRTEPGAAYELERELGRGGMATVYLARDAKHGRRVAVKVLGAGLTTLVGAEEFVREIRLTARLQHPHVLGLIDSGVFGPEAGALAGRPYYTMPYVEGETLRARLLREKVLPLPEAVRVLRDVADALCYAHERGIVHRDIKPENILLAGGHAMVADFGIATALQASRPDDGEPTARLGADGALRMPRGTVAGTAAYMSPEQAAGATGVDHRTDLYAWGVIAYELLAGRRPLGERTRQRERRGADIGESPRPLRELAPMVPELLARLIMRCLAKDPLQRPESAAELLAALDAVRPATATPIVRRRLLSSGARWLAGFAALALLLVFGTMKEEAARRAGRGERFDIIPAGTAPIRAAEHAVVVVGRGKPAVDIAAVQAAVDRADTVVLKGRFSFDAPPTKPIALTLASGWFAPAAEVMLSKAVVIRGIRDAVGAMATIEGGTIPFYVDAPGKHVAIVGLRFVRPVSRAILIYAVRGAEVATCRVEGVVPFAGYGGGIAINTQGGIPTPASPGTPESISGRLLLDRNEIDATGGTTDDMTTGIGVFSAGRSPDREVQLDIIGNEIINTSTSPIVIRRLGGRVRVLRNTLRTAPMMGAGGTEAVRLVNSGSYLMAGNLVDCRWADCVGIAVFSQFAEWPIERAVVEDNEIRMSPPPDAELSDSTAGIEISGFALGNVVRRNTVRGRARSGLSMRVFLGGVPTDNEFIDNGFDHFAAGLADIVIGRGVLRRRIVGRGTLADRGVGTVVER